MSSKSSAPRTTAAPAYTAPVAPITPIAPPPPVPAAPVPYYETQEAASNEKTNSNVSKSRIGRAALKINLVNSGNDDAGFSVNTTN
jgi:hypothetical protein